MALASLGVANQRPLVLGLTGSIGMGKSTASEWWRRAGIRVHDSDATVHALYGAGGAAVEPIGAAFPGVIAADGGIDRAALSQAIAVAGREHSLSVAQTSAAYAIEHGEPCGIRSWPRDFAERSILTCWSSRPTCSSSDGD